MSDHRSIPNDRRRSQRYAAQGTSALIGWCVEGQFQTIPATLIDISLGGFKASVEAFPPLGEAVWLRLDGEPPSSWIRATVIETITTGVLCWTRRRVRLRFLENCPYDFFKAAIEGFTREYQYQDGSIEGFNAREWR